MLIAKLTRTESKFSLVIMLFVRGSAVVPTICSSHDMGTPALEKTRLTAAAISGPMPSPGNRVHSTGVEVLARPRENADCGGKLDLTAEAASSRLRLIIAARRCP